MHTKWRSYSFFILVAAFAGCQTVEYTGQSQAAAKPDYQWEFKVLQGKEVNAFCLPSGKVTFWEGISKIVHEDACDACACEPAV